MAGIVIVRMSDANDIQSCLLSALYIRTCHATVMFNKAKHMLTVCDHPVYSGILIYINYPIKKGVFIRVYMERIATGWENKILLDGWILTLQ